MRVECRTAGRTMDLESAIGNGENRYANQRLLSPTEAAIYLGLTSRFAIYRLVSSGTLPAIRLANKAPVEPQTACAPGAPAGDHAAL